MRLALLAVAIVLFFCVVAVRAQQADPPPPPTPDGGPGGPGGGQRGPGGFGGFGGGGFGGGGPGQQEVKLLKQFDKDGDKKLNLEERKAAREYLAKERANGRGQRGFGRNNGNPEAVEPGPKLTPGDVKSYGKESLYDPHVLRTFFLEFESADWEKELSDFKNSDVEVPAKLTVDGKVYKDVGVHFRGMSSYMMIPAGKKRSLTITTDFVNKKHQGNWVMV